MSDLYGVAVLILEVLYSGWDSNIIWNELKSL